jgi:hypothetical protein
VKLTEASQELHNAQSILTLNPASNMRKKDNSPGHAKVVNLNDAVGFQNFSTVQQGRQAFPDHVYLKNQMLSLKQRNVNSGNCNTSVSRIDTSNPRLYPLYDQSRVPETQKARSKRGHDDDNRDVLNKSYVASDDFTSAKQAQTQSKRFESQERQSFKLESSQELEQFQVSKVVLQNRKADHSLTGKQAAANKNVKFNMSAQFNPGEIGKCERRGESYLGDGKPVPVGRSYQLPGEAKRRAVRPIREPRNGKQKAEDGLVRNLSSKHSSLHTRPTPILRNSRLSQHLSLDAKASLIKSLNTHATTRPSSKLPSIFSPKAAGTPETKNPSYYAAPQVDTHCGLGLITVRNKKFQQNRQDFKEQFMQSVGVLGKNFKNNINTKVALLSQHNRFLRVRDGGWGNIEGALSSIR